MRSQLDLGQIRTNNVQWFNQLMESTTLTEKTSAKYQNLVGKHIKEASVYEKIVPAQTITPAECEIGPHDDSMNYRIHFEPNTRVGLGSMDAGPEEYQEIYLERIFGSFQVLTTPMWEFNEYRLMAYQFNVPSLVEQNIGPDFQEGRDWAIHQALEQSIQANRTRFENVYKGTNVTAIGTATDTARVKISLDDVSNLRGHFADGRRGELVTALIPERDWVDVSSLGLGEFGDTLQGRVAVEGYNLPTVQGVKFIRTKKTDSANGDIFQTGNIYAFGAAERIGVHFDLHGPKTFIDREMQFMRMASRICFGFTWFGGSEVAKLELYQRGRNLDGTFQPASAVDDAGAADKAGSDQLWNDPRSVIERDLNDLTTNPQRPVIDYGLIA